MWMFPPLTELRARDGRGRRASGLQLRVEVDGGLSFGWNEVEVEIISTKIHES